MPLIGVTDKHFPTIRPILENVAGILTKALARPTFDVLAQKMGLRQGYDSEEVKDKGQE